MSANSRACRAKDAVVGMERSPFQFIGTLLRMGFLFVMEGRRAREAGQPITDDPYEPGSDQSDLWNMGWNEGAALPDDSKAANSSSLAI
jgi:hypothetical protein